ncbi:sugar transferase [Candidatus Woesebacteria bacterium]|nr:sugar transferase [Candidatus Woesebacteria bacterium]
MASKELFSLSYKQSHVLRQLPVKIKEAIYPTGGKYLRSWQKRAFDIAGALAIAPFAAMGIGLGALAIKLDDGGPVFFTLNVPGPKGSVIPQYKLRTMRPESTTTADALNRKHDEQHRVTRVGRLLRQWSIDELPQVINVLKGEMHLVGNRPNLPDRLHAWSEDDFLQEDYFRWAHASAVNKPGCANVGILHGRAHLDETEDGRKRRLRLERYFLEHNSLAMDLKVIIKNIGAVIKRDGAY